MMYVAALSDLYEWAVTRLTAQLTGYTVAAELPQTQARPYVFVSELDEAPGQGVFGGLGTAATISIRFYSALDSDAETAGAVSAIRSALDGTAFTPSGGAGVAQGRLVTASTAPDPLGGRMALVRYRYRVVGT